MRMDRGRTQRGRCALPSGKLFIAVVAAFAIDEPLAAAVTSCADDGGSDTLRHAVLVANDGDTIDLTALTCSKITLASAITTGLPNLTIAGPGASKLAIDGNEADRVFVHAPSLDGTLTLSNMTLSHGKASVAPSYGGCVYSKANVVLRNAVVTSCSAVGPSHVGGGGVVTIGDFKAYASVLSGNTATAQTGISGVTSAIGGGAFALGNIGLYGSVISGNTVSSPLGKVYGGGAATPNVLTVKYSTITGNHATSAGSDADIGEGGGVAMSVSSEILGSTLDHNVADAGGAVAVFSSASGSAAIVQTTISGNTGNLGAGAVLANAAVNFANSTIAFNTSGSVAPSAVGIFTGVAISASSTIMADNVPIDVDSGSPTTITGDHDLIKLAGANVTVPALTISLDPDLGPLAWNGGYTQTHALGASSVAVGAGSKPDSLEYDQRGPPYARSTGGHVDIGAYQQDNDHIFGNPFEFGPLY
jgi:hypothetical protein